MCDSPAPGPTDPAAVEAEILSLRQKLSALEHKLRTLTNRARTGGAKDTRTLAERIRDEIRFEDVLKGSSSNSLILRYSALNKGTAFDEEERNKLGLTGLLPPQVESLDDQLARALQQLRDFKEPLQKHIFLASLSERNETLFYKLVLTHMIECTPLIYTPTVGEACTKFSHIWRNPKGMYISLKERGRVRQVLDNWIYPRVDIIVVSDGSRILGLGDLGANGMGIPIGKLSLYVAGAGFYPSRTLPILLDTGTANKAFREDPNYLGLRQDRAPDDEFYALAEEFMTAVKDKWPKVLVQFEDFSNNHCFDLLEKYRHRQLCFNDDIQGTGAVILAGFINACKIMGKSGKDQRILFFGAGSAAVGVADMIATVLAEEGLSEEELRKRFWFVDSRGLVHTNRGDKLPPQKVRFARTDVPEGQNYTSLLDTVRYVKPTCLIGLSGIGQSFTEEVVKAVVDGLEDKSIKPIIFALSNPTKNSECSFPDAINWTDGNVIFASGSPFDDVEHKGKTYCCAQGNNMYIFPGLGFGSSLCKAKEVSDKMIVTAAKALADTVTQEQIAEGLLYPALTEIRTISAQIATAVINAAIEEGLAQFRKPSIPILEFVKSRMYNPAY